MAKLKHFGILKIKHFVIIVTLFVLGSCKKETKQHIPFQKQMENSIQRQATLWPILL